MAQSKNKHPAGSNSLSRRDFLKASLVAGAAGLLAACKPALAPTATTTPPHTLADTVTPTVTLENIPDATLHRPEIGKFYPDTPKSTVVRTRHAGLWNNQNELIPQALRQMLDASIVQLTGIANATQAWQALVSPEERIAIKVNSYVTHAPLALAVCDCLQSAGIPPEQIYIYDRYSGSLLYDFLIFAGYSKVNRDGPGVRCYGTSETGPGVRSSSDPTDHYVMGWQLMDTQIGLSEILMNCHALINMPGLSTVTYAGMGISFALKNHYGSFNCPSSFHADRFAGGVSELNALAPIRERTRLVIGDALLPRTFNNSDRLVIGERTLLMSYDPLAVDAVGLQLAIENYTASHLDTQVLSAQAAPWLAAAEALGIGASKPDNIEVKNIDLA